MGTIVQTVQRLIPQETYAKFCQHDYEGVLSRLGSQDSVSDKTRYKFEQGTPQERAVKAVFEHAFSRDSVAVLAAAEVEVPLYPKWKSVCRIEIPKVIGNAINHPYVKIALTIVALYYTYVTCQAAYYATVELTARSLPFIINNTPIQIIRLGNMALDLKDYVRKNVLRILFYTWVARTIVINGPEMPVVTPLARRINIWAMWNAIVHSPSTIFRFLVENSLYAATFTWNACTEAGEFINGRVEQAEKERLAICKAKALEVWKRVNNS